MDNLQIIGVLLSLIAFQSCSKTYIIKPYDGPPELELTDFCELYRIESGEYISTIAYYTGVEEYWSLTSKTPCELDYQVYLNTEENYQERLNVNLSKKFSHLYENYWKYSLKLEIIGIIENTEEELGFGHLGLKKIQIIPYQIRILEKNKIKVEK
ncbi:hypothetical protein [Neolewinella litorea]|uniref:Uncharacterized protein n=1 Tax=Neolewinella litorea TaxID=2562452 RepID=A0A4S4NC55_9BACT|nr:hypothetical protein [Neolewinella litorea]THH36295.1 hypothetical protein E4021_15405 [Neolewinella litorea]